MKLNIEFQNYKLLKDTKATLDGSNVYLVQGANEQGKTSFINGLLTMLQAENKTKQPVTMGEKKGKISLDLQTKGGKDFKILFEFTDEKNKFTLISDNQLMSKVTDIRSFLQYQSLTADEFISWSNTAEGKRKQRDIVLGLRGDDVKEKFVELTNKENILYADRADANAEAKTLETFNLNFDTKITDADREEIKKLDTYILLKNDIEKNIQNATSNNIIAADINNELNNIKNACDNLNNIYVENNLNSPRHSDALEDIKIHINRQRKNMISINDLRGKQNELIELINKITLRSEQIDHQTKHENKLAEVKEIAEKLTDQITEMRQAKTKLIADSDFPLEDVVIDDECLWIKTADGLLPFDINQVSTSRIMIIVAKIILMLNKHLPIIVMGRGEAFDKEKLAELSKFADENECMLIIDKVTDTAGIEIVGYESN